MKFDIELIIIQKTRYSKETTKAGKKHEKIPETLLRHHYLFDWAQTIAQFVLYISPPGLNDDRATGKLKYCKKADMSIYLAIQH